MTRYWNVVNFNFKGENLTDEFNTFLLADGDLSRSFNRNMELTLLGHSIPMIMIHTIETQDSPYVQTTIDILKILNKSTDKKDVFILSTDVTSPEWITVPMNQKITILVEPV